MTRSGRRDGGRVHGRFERLWLLRLKRHAPRLLLLAGLAALVQLLFPSAPVANLPVLEKGMVAESDVIAEVTFPIYKSREQLAREREEAAFAVAPLLEFDPAAADTMLGRVRTFFARVDTAAGTGDAAIDDVLASYGFPPGTGAGALLGRAPQRAALRRAVEAAIAAELPRGVAASADVEETGAAFARVRGPGARETLLPRDSLETASRFYDRAARHLPAASAAELSELQRLVLIRFFQPSLGPNREATEAARQRARQAVPTTRAVVRKGQRIVGASEQVRDVELERLEAYRAQLVRLGMLSAGGRGGLHVVGGFLYNLLLLLVFGLLLRSYRPTVYHDLRQVSLLAGLVLLLVGAAAVIARSEAPIQLIPIAVPALVAGALWDGRLALHFALILAVLLGGQTPFLGVSVPFTLVIGGAAAALSVRVVRRRAESWIIASLIAAAYGVVALTLGFLRGWGADEILRAAGWGALNAVASPLIVMGLLPLFEAVARITTDQTLLELSDLNRPLLQRLQREAGGTFSHSLGMANLAEAAARAIGANALLARVGAYYHDIGKLAQPQYFIENQPAGQNPHDRLEPASSAAIVRGHVQEGLRIGAAYRLPDRVRAFIAEHHGTHPITFFLEQARERGGAAAPDPQEFHYHGPKPRSRETAIAMLADSVESASRVLQDPTPERIRDLVERIVGSKTALGQLDESPLTFRDLARVKEQFISVLADTHHQRIDYPAGGDRVPATPRLLDDLPAGSR